MTLRECYVSFLGYLKKECSRGQPKADHTEHIVENNVTIIFLWYSAPEYIPVSQKVAVIQFLCNPVAYWFAQLHRVPCIGQGYCVCFGAHIGFWINVCGTRETLSNARLQVLR